jgi:integrase
MVLFRYQAFEKPSSNQAAELDCSPLRDLQTKASAHNLCAEARDLIFRTPSGQPISADYLGKHFRSILDIAGVPRLRLYDLRHSAAISALAAGVAPKVVSELGHASTAFTLDTYAHVLPQMQDEAAARVEADALSADSVTGRKH